MFAIGEKITEVNKSRVAMPVEYHLRKRKIVWNVGGAGSALHL